MTKNFPGASITEGKLYVLIPKHVIIIKSSAKEKIEIEIINYYYYLVSNTENRNYQLIPKHVIIIKSSAKEKIEIEIINYYYFLVSNTENRNY
jgi:hypothetical protein